MNSTPLGNMQVIYSKYIEEIASIIFEIKVVIGVIEM